MATKSLTKTICISSKSALDSFINALDQNQRTKKPRTKLTHNYTRANNDNIRSMFGIK